MNKLFSHLPFDFLKSDKCFTKLPLFSAMDHSLSFNKIIKLVLNVPALFNPSYAWPPVKAPSPITVIILYFSLLISRALAKPVENDMDHFRLDS